MCLYWGIIPVLGANVNQKSELQDLVQDWAGEEVTLRSGDRVVYVTDSESIEKAHDMMIVGTIS